MWKWPCLLWSPLRVASSKHIRWERWCRRCWTVINTINIIFAVPLTYLELYLPIYFKTYLMCKAIQDRAESSKLGLLMRWFKILNKIFFDPNKTEIPVSWTSCSKQKCTKVSSGQDRSVANSSKYQFLCKVIFVIKCISVWRILLNVPINMPTQHVKNALQK